MRIRDLALGALTAVMLASLAAPAYAVGAGILYNRAIKNSENVKQFKLPSKATAATPAARGQFFGANRGHWDLPPILDPEAEGTPEREALATAFLICAKIVPGKERAACYRDNCTVSRSLLSRWELVRCDQTIRSAAIDAQQQQLLAAKK